MHFVREIGFRKRRAFDMSRRDIIGCDMPETRPLNPLLSQFPLPMTEAQARREGRRARKRSLRLPNGHPYAVAPTWVPLKAALAFERFRLRCRGQRPAGVFVESDAES
jgi:hypothetical protein